jgi:hypothetical protein
MFNQEEVNIMIFIRRKDNTFSEVPLEVWEWTLLEKWGVSQLVESQPLDGNKNMQSNKSIKENKSLLLGPLEWD